MPGWLLILLVAVQRVEVRTCEVTAYCPCKKCCGRFADGVTASGVPAIGPIVAAPSNVCFNAIVFVPGYGLATVQDRGGAIMGNRLDVLMPTHWAAREWGRQVLTVLVWR